MAKKRAPPLRFVQLYHYVTDTAAWQDLDGNARATYLEIAKRYYPARPDGPASNNGKIPFSVREAVRHWDEKKKRMVGLPISLPTASRAIKSLVDHGFLVCTRKGNFDQKRIASEWRLTEHPTGHNDGLATKEFTRWAPAEIQKPVSPRIPDSFTTDTSHSKKPPYSIPHETMTAENRADSFTTNTPWFTRGEENGGAVLETVLETPLESGAKKKAPVIRKSAITSKPNGLP